MATVHDWLREHDRPVRYRVGSRCAFAERVAAGDDFRFVLREFSDDVNLATAVRPIDLATMIEPRPPQPDDRRQHAFLGAMAEHLAMVHELPHPAWATEDDRFLLRWWSVADDPAYDAVALRDAPPAFRRRAVFLPASMLERV